MAVSLGGTATATTASAASITSGSMSPAPTAGSTIAVVLRWSLDTSETFTGVTDAAGNAYTKVAGIITGGAGGVHLAIYRKCNAAVVGSHTVTATWSAASSAQRLIAVEIKGADTTESFDVQAPTNNFNSQASPGTGANAVTSTAATTTAAGEFILGEHTTSDAGAFTTGTGFTAITTVSNNVKVQYQIQTSAGSIASTQTINPSAQTYSVMATFKAAAAGGVVMRSTPKITSTVAVQVAATW